MKRREFITLLGGAAAWPLAARAQQTKIPTIGFLGTTTSAAWGPWTTVFMQRLRELGWIDGQNVAIVVRWAEGRSERFAELTAEFVRLNVNVIFTGGTPAIAAKQATSVIPIVFVLASDPVGIGLVASLARPGGNITGLSTQATDIVGKRIELLGQILPAFRRLSVLTNAANPAAIREVEEVQASGRTVGLEVTSLEIRRAEDIAPAFERLKDSAQALYVCADPLLFTYRGRINTLALGVRLPTMHTTRESVDVSGLMSYAPNYPDQFRRAAEIVDKILRGAKPADIPVEQPTKFDLVINLTTAKALSLEVPPMLLARADEVIE
jgi:putative tryptophan/tyrosine transport system substrate-binding protein